MGHQAAGVAAKSDELEVWLPVCPVEGCGQIGKVPMPNGNRGYVAFCTGPMGNSHGKTHMRTQRFVAVNDD